jgi:hypothetical protein
MFAYFSGTGSVKYTDKEIERIAISSADPGYCNLCDAAFAGAGDKHVRAHMRDLREWRKQRRREVEKAGAARLKNARAERRLVRESIREPTEEEEE